MKILAGWYSGNLKSLNLPTYSRDPNRRAPPFINFRDLFPPPRCLLAPPLLLKLTFFNMNISKDTFSLLCFNNKRTNSPFFVLYITKRIS